MSQELRTESKEPANLKKMQNNSSVGESEADEEGAVTELLERLDHLCRPQDHKLSKEAKR